MQYRDSCAKNEMTDCVSIGETSVVSAMLVTESLRATPSTDLSLFKISLVSVIKHLQEKRLICQIGRNPLGWCVISLAA